MPIILSAGKHFECQFCNKQFVREASFMKHRCEKMIRHETLATTDGQRALDIYRKWMHAKRFIEPSPDAFTCSKHYNSLMKFARFAKKLGLRDINSFITWSVKQDIPPSMWCLPDAQGEFSAWRERSLTPIKLFRSSLDEMEVVADREGVDISDVFEVITPSELVHLVQQRRVSAWFLFNSKKFGAFYLADITGQNKVIFDAFIDSVQWKKTFEKHKKERNTIKDLMEHIGL